MTLCDTEEVLARVGRNLSAPGGGPVPYRYYGMVAAYPRVSVLGVGEDVLEGGIESAVIIESGAKYVSKSANHPYVCLRAAAARDVHQSLAD